MIAHAKRRHARLFLTGVVLVLLAACASSPSETPRPVARSVPAAAPGHAKVRPDVAHRAARVALQQVGVPYRYGGQSPATGFDCSGLVHFAYLEAGKAIPRTTKSLWSDTQRVRRADLERGDLVFFSIKGKMQHVGLYLGDGRFVHAPSTGRRVSVESLSSPYYRDALLGGGRPR